MLKRVKRAFSKPDNAEVRPLLSIVVVVYDMPTQAQNTLISLGTQYQQEVSTHEFEVIVVENESPNLLNDKFVQSLPSNVHYYKRQETQPTPVHAINFGASKAKGDYICLMIDGARMLTPRVVKNLLLGHKLSDYSVVSIPGYHLGDKLQQESVSDGYGLETERELMRSIQWPSDGYQLFDIACFSGSSACGFFLPNSESNCISVPRDLWQALGGFDAQFNLRGGGLINLDFYRRACEYPGVQHVIIPGEGTFHQFHGGVTTGGEASDVRDAYIEACKEQYRELRGEDYSSPDTDPVYLGQLPRQSQKFLHFSSGKWLKSRGEKPFPEFF
jgi:glycosyltransferase involved in cell wall biosynthesis